jgi:hypothetical protein
MAQRSVGRACEESWYDELWPSRRASRRALAPAATQHINNEFALFNHWNKGRYTGTIAGILINIFFCFKMLNRQLN